MTIYQNSRSPLGDICHETSINDIEAPPSLAEAIIRSYDGDPGNCRGYQADSDPETLILEDPEGEGTFIPAPRVVDWAGFVATAAGNIPMSSAGQ